MVEMTQAVLDDDSVSLVEERGGRWMGMKMVE